jgi:hypothetical protein
VVSSYVTESFAVVTDFRTSVKTALAPTGKTLVSDALAIDEGLDDVVAEAVTSTEAVTVTGTVELGEL